MKKSEVIASVHIVGLLLLLLSNIYMLLNVSSKAWLAVEHSNIVIKQISIEAIEARREKFLIFS